MCFHQLTLFFIAAHIVFILFISTPAADCENPSMGGEISIETHQTEEQ